METIDREALLLESIDFAFAYSLAKKMDFEELAERVSNIHYESFGAGALMLFRWQHTNMWDFGLRNQKDWQEKLISFQAPTLRETFSWAYAWAVYKKLFK